MSAGTIGFLLGLWGEEVYTSGLVGNDYQGHFIKDELESIGINTKYLELNPDVKTDSSYIIANKSNGSRTILSHVKGREGKYLSLDISEKFDLIMLDGDEVEAAKKVLGNNPDAISVLDAGSLREGTVALCPYVTYLACSHDFAEDYTNMKIDYDDINTIIPVYEKLKEDLKNTVIITLEDRGSFAKIDGEYN